ncbi:unnamed protein product [Polarella glacialis]|uniref:Uncharacterized protein n=1 Tax=Polarella glacialis TaxID=89957 RepID=A0A813K1B9_POLGL|nr:unnamed protein product [Polarella glacialis]
MLCFLWGSMCVTSLSTFAVAYIAGGWYGRGPPQDGRSGPQMLFHAVFVGLRYLFLLKFFYNCLLLVLLLFVVVCLFCIFLYALSICKDTTLAALPSVRCCWPWSGS